MEIQIQEQDGDVFRVPAGLTVMVCPERGDGLSPLVAGCVHSIAPSCFAGAAMATYATRPGSVRATDFFLSLVTRFPPVGIHRTTSNNNNIGCSWSCQGGARVEPSNHIAPHCGC